MYDDHREGLAVLRQVTMMEGDLPTGVRRRLVREAEGMLDHMEDCGVLLFRVQALAPIVQSRLEDRLFSWRTRSPRWTELSLAHQT